MANFVLSNYNKLNATASVTEGTVNSILADKSKTPDVMTRYAGGHQRDHQIYISGYWYFFLCPPAKILTLSNTTTDGNAADTNAAVTKIHTRELWMHTTAESFTPPSRNLNKIDVPGLGGVGSSYVGGQSLTRTFSVTFRERQNTPVYNMFNEWCSMFDPHYGITPFKAADFVPKSYKGKAIAVLCKPTLKPTLIIGKEDIEQIFVFRGVFPEGAPTDAFSADINQNDSVTLSINFSFDGWFSDKSMNDDEFVSVLAAMNTVIGYDEDGNTNDTYPAYYFNYLIQD